MSEDRIGPFEKLNEYRGEELPDGVYVALQSVPYIEGNESVWEIKGPSSWLTHLAQFYLCVGYPRNGSAGDENRMQERYRRMKFNNAVEEIARIGVHSALTLLPGRTSTLLPSRINGERAVFTTFAEDEHIVLLEIPRGGSWISLLAQKEILPPWVGEVGRLYAAAQRELIAGRVKVHITKIAGACRLSGSSLVTMEQALATGSTLCDGIPEVYERCQSTPARLIIFAFNACTRGIKAVKEKFPEATILVVILHGGINDDGYLIHPGCGDVGRMDAGVPDALEAASVPLA